jgi:predicted permease
MTALVRDLVAALRSLRLSPGTAGVAILTLALGTGVNTAVIAIAYGLLLRPLPYADPSRLVVVETVGGGALDVPLQTIDEWRARQRATDSLSAYASTEITMRGTHEPRVLNVGLVTADFFATLGVHPQRGRVLTGDNDTGVVISARLGRTLEAEGISLPGGGLRLADRGYDIVGIMPPSFAFPNDEIDAWIPAASAPGVRVFNDTDARRFQLIGRLRSDVGIEQARFELQRVDSELQAMATRRQEQRTIVVRSLRDSISGSMRPVMRVFVASAVLVLLVACANVATLLAGRAVAKSRELAVRLAIGAEPRRLVRAALTESFCIAAIGSALGIGFAALLLRIFSTYASGVVHHLGTISIDLPVLVATVGIALVTTMACGAAPALQASRTDFAVAFRDTTASHSRTGRRLRFALVVVQVALSIVLLAGAGLLTRTVLRLMTENIGIEPQHGLAATLMMGETRRFDAASRGPFMRELLRRVRALPGIREAGLGSNLPPSVMQIQIGIRFDRSQEMQMLSLAGITPGYVSALGGRLIRGRFFEPGDEQAGGGVALLSETAVRVLSRDRDPIGRQIAVSLPRASGGRFQPRVVGVIADIKYQGLDAPANGSIYLPWEELPASVSYLVVRTEGAPAQSAAAVREVVREMEPSMPVPSIRPLEDEMRRSIAERRLRVVPALGFAALALVVALVGLSGALARTVTERRRELAIRAALGATPGRAVSTVVRDGVRMTITGLFLGLAVSTFATPLLAKMLYGVGPLDPLTYGLVVGVIAICALISCIVPARRASRVDPLEILKAS